MEKTLSIIKPNAVKHAGKILTILQEELVSNISYMKMIKFTKEQATIFYEEHKERDTFSELVDFMSSGPSIILVLYGPNIIKEHRNIMKKIRELYSEDFMKNAIHGSDSVESSQREIDFIFKEFENCKKCEIIIEAVNNILLPGLDKINKITEDKKALDNKLKS